jgi:hypothetical protein
MGFIPETNNFLFHNNMNIDLPPSRPLQDKFRRYRRR